MSIIRTTRSLPLAARSHSALRPTSAPHPTRTHSCGELSTAHAGAHVVLAGWLLPERYLPYLLPTLQLMISPNQAKSQTCSPSSPSKTPRARHSLSSVTVQISHPSQTSLSSPPSSSKAAYPSGQKRTVAPSVPAPRPPLPAPHPPKSSTGDIEVHVDSFTVLNPASPLPFYPSDDQTLVRLPAHIRTASH